MKREDDLFMAVLTNSRHLTIPCSQCGAAAAELSLLPETVNSKVLYMGGDRLERTEFLDKVVRFGHIERLYDLFESIRREEYQTARVIDPDFASFVCEVCERPYCEACWIIEHPDDDFYQPTTGSCPVGHRQVLDS
jgi:hypothetical protein